MTMLSELLSSRIRAEVFRLLFDGGGAELHMRDMQRRSDCAIGALQAELKKLARLDLVASRRDGNRRYYRARTDHPLYGDLCSLVRKTVGVVGLLQTALADCQEIDCAFVFGSLANDGAQAGSDVDLMVVGAIGLRALTGRLAMLTEQCGREVNPHVFSVADFAARIRAHDHFLMNVMQAKKVFVTGGEDDLAKLGG